MMHLTDGSYDAIEALFSLETILVRPCMSKKMTQKDLKLRTRKCKLAYRVSPSSTNQLVYLHLPTTAKFGILFFSMRERSALTLSRLRDASVK